MDVRFYQHHFRNPEHSEPAGARKRDENFNLAVGINPADSAERESRPRAAFRDA